jgi:hypothetical protein
MTNKVGWLTNQKVPGPVAGLFVAFLAAFFSAHAIAQTPTYGGPGGDQSAIGATTAGKSGYNLFDMTPASLRRPFYTDHGVASPYTIDAGAYAISLYGTYATRDRESMGYDHSIDWWNAGAVVKAGLFNNFDVEAMLPSYQFMRETFKSASGSDYYSARGWDDFSLTGKLNLIGNDGGPASWAIAGTVRFPTANYEIKPRDYYAGGLSSRFSYTCPSCGCEMRMENGFMVEDRDFVNEDGDDEDCWDACFCDDIGFYSPEWEGWQAYTALDTQVSTSSRENWQCVQTLGGTYNLNPNWQLFAQGNFGLNGAIPDYGTTIGLDFRFP